MTDHVCVYVNDREQCSTCGRAVHKVRVSFTLPDGDVALWLPASTAGQTIADVLAANPVATYRITGRKS